MLRLRHPEGDDPGPCSDCGHTKIGETYRGLTTCMFELVDHGFGDAEYCECTSWAHVPIRERVSGRAR